MVRTETLNVKEKYFKEWGGKWNPEFENSIIVDESHMSGRRGNSRIIWRSKT